MFLTTGALRGARCYGIRRVEQIPILFSHRKKKAEAEACLFYFDSYAYLFIDLWLAHEGDHRIYLLGNISVVCVRESQNRQTDGVSGQRFAYDKVLRNIPPLPRIPVVSSLKVVRLIVPYCL